MSKKEAKIIYLKKNLKQLREQERAGRMEDGSQTVTNLNHIY
jgi:hypothetical protein